MSKIVHRINAPCISGIVMSHMCHTINNRISHIHIGRSHIDLCTEYFLSICKFSVLHVLKQLQVLLYAAVTVRAVLTRLSQGSTILSDLLGRKVAHISLSFLNELHSGLIHLLEIIRSKEQSVIPFCPQPFYIGFDGLYELCLLFGRVRIIKTQVELSAIFFCQSVIQQNGLGMSNVQISVGLRRKAGMHGIINAFCKVFVNLCLYKILGNDFILHHLFLLGFKTVFYHSILSLHIARLLCYLFTNSCTVS